MDQVLQTLKDFFAGLVSRLETIEAALVPFLNTDGPTIAQRLDALAVENEDLKAVVSKYGSLVEELSKRVAALEAGGGGGMVSVVAALNAEVRKLRDDHFARNPNSTTFKIEVLPGYFQVWDRARLSTPVWTECDSRLRVNHNLTIIANSDGGVGAGGHGHLVFRVNRSDGKTQEFQLFCGRDGGDRTVLVAHPLEVGHPDPIHAINRNDEVDAFFWMEQTIQGRGGFGFFGLQRRRLTPPVGPSATDSKT